MSQQWYDAISGLDPEIRDELMNMAGYVKISGEGQSQLDDTVECRSFAHTDLGNAERFVHQHKDDIRYCTAAKTWYIWNGQYWEEDITEMIYSLARVTIRSIPREADSCSEDDFNRSAILKWAARSESRERVRAMVELAQSDRAVAIRPDFFDHDPWLLNCRNGTLNLHTGLLQSHDRQDYISKQAPVDFDPQAVCPTWERFIGCIFQSHGDLIEYVRRVCGYCLTGITREQDFYFLYGTGANGKSTLIKTMMALLGTEYATQASSGTLWARHYEAPGEEVAVLQGARLVVAMETDQGRKLAEGLVKQLTGGDRIRARRLYANSFEFQPTFKVFLAANHKPGISGTDNGIWRRIKMIPFMVSIPEDQQDVDLGEKLLSELPGILNWTLRGCLDWQQQGLKPPRQVTQATTDYRQDSDYMAAFLAECVMIDDGSRTQCKVVYEAYQNWAACAGDRPLNLRRFNDCLKEKGFQTQAGTGNRKFWLGLALRDNQADWSDISHEIAEPSYPVT